MPRREKNLPVPVPPAPEPKPEPPPVNPVPPPLVALDLPTGPIKTPAPPRGGSFGVPWENITRWQPSADQAAREMAQRFGVALDWRLLLAMVAVESRGNPTAYRAADGTDDVPAVGLMQVKLKYHQWRVPDADGTTPLGNLRLGAAIMADGIKRLGSWQRALTEIFFPVDDKNGTTRQAYVKAVEGLMAELTADTAPTPMPVPTFPWPVRWWSVAGLPPDKRIALPADCDFIIDLTPVGRNRPGVRATLDGGTQHDTGNKGIGADANMHSTWQDNGTPGHPDGYVAVTFYTDDHRVIQKIPVNETSIHAGDWRNQRHWPNELCVNADRSWSVAERNAQALDAGLLYHQTTNATKDLYPHRPGGCPASINTQGRWSAWERAVDSLVKCYQGVTPPDPPPIVVEYATARPVDDEFGRPWDGTDRRRADGTTFIALRRVFVAAQDGVKCRLSADDRSPEVRPALPKGEPCEAFYVVRSGSDDVWIVTRYGSRILSGDLLPRLDVFADVEVADWDTANPDLEWPVLYDPHVGLSGAEPVADAVALTKAEFMALADQTDEQKGRNR